LEKEKVGKDEKCEKEKRWLSMNLKIAIVAGSVRKGRNAEAVSKWMLEFAKKRKDADYELVDLMDYKLPLLGMEVSPEEEEKANIAIKTWSDKMSSFDGYIFITPEYNHAVGGALKNALDYLNIELNNKAAGLVGYGSLGGVRAHENMRLILGELQVADVRTAVTFSLMTDFETMSVFKPAAYHEGNANMMLDQVLAWSKALKTIRN